MELPKPPSVSEGIPNMEKKMAIEIVLSEPVPDDFSVRNIKVSPDKRMLTGACFEELILLNQTDIEKLNALSIEIVTCLNCSVGVISTRAGLYVLEGGTVVHIETHISTASKSPLAQSHFTIRAPSLVAFMDSYAMALNNKLTGLELRPSATETFGKVAQVRKL